MKRRPVRARTVAFLGLLALAASSAALPNQDPPKEARRAFDKAAAAVKAKRPDEAILDYRQAVALYPAYAEAWCELGKLLLNRQQPDAAKSALEAAIHADSKYVDAYLALAALQQSARNWPQLVAVTEQLLALNPIDFPQAWLLNGIGNYNLRNFAAAEKSAREAERLDTRHRFPETWRLLGLALARRGDSDGAAEQFQRYLAAVPSGPDADKIRALLAGAAATAAATAAPSAADFRTETTLAVVRFELRPNKGQPAQVLRPEDIEVREDGVAQKIALFEGGAVSTRTIPVEISLLFDCSSSVERIAAFGTRLFRENLLDEFPNTSIAVYGFSDDLVRFAQPTRDPATLKKAIDLVASIPKRNTPLFGSIADTIRDAGATGANVVRMVVVLSDGESASPGDENRAEEAARVAAESGTAIFPVMLSGPGPLAMEAAGSIRDFMNLASETGGKEYHGMMGTDVLPAVLKELAGEIRSGYVAGFYVPASGEPKPRKIEVILRSKDRGRLYGGVRTLIH